jgi:putative transposase
VPVLLSILYLLVRRLIGLARRPEDVDKDIEIAVLCHQLHVLRREVGRPTYRPSDRLFLAAASRLVPRERWSAFR